MVCALPLPSECQTFQTLHNFVQPAAGPYASVIEAADGYLYGTTFGGGSNAGLNGSGTVFRVRPDGSDFRMIHLFSANLSGEGSSPYGGVIQGTDGDLYGTASVGGSDPFFPDGVVFRMATDGSGYRLLHSFGYDTKTGREPRAGLLQGLDGGLYGTTYSGGTFGGGVVFRVTPDGSDFRVVHAFNPENQTDGANPYDCLIQASDGQLYGTTVKGGAHGAGTVFRLAADGSSFQVIQSFNAADTSNGANPRAALLQATDGNLYGTTPSGGAFGFGVIFRITLGNLAFQLVYSFNQLDQTLGDIPYAALIQGSDGALYGTTFGSVWGTVFRINLDGSHFQTIHSFVGFSPNDGTSPYAPLVQGSDHALYGTTFRGGATDLGTVFRIQPDGSGYELVCSFGTSEGAWPYAGVLLSSDGSLYGTAMSAGAHGVGSIFKMNIDGSAFQVLHSFVALDVNDGANPFGGLIEGSDGSLYGTTSGGGFYGAGVTGPGTAFTIRRDGTGFKLLMAGLGGPLASLVQASDGNLYGTAANTQAGGDVFKLTPGGAYQPLHVFTGPDGVQPDGALIQGADGILYGTTRWGGLFSAGTIFAIRMDGTGFDLVHSFDLALAAAPGGFNPVAGLLQASDGSLYGTTLFGGAYHYGSVFKINTNGTGFQVLHSFLWTDPNDGASPQSQLIEGLDGYLYGTTSGGGSGFGTVFRIHPDGSAFAVVHAFNGSDGAGPVGGLAQGPEGDLFGTTEFGGTYGAGTVFRLLAIPPRLAVAPKRHRSSTVVVIRD
jgi:uncharacterized repeat protein (TIGR03803 family)